MMDVVVLLILIFLLTGITSFMIYMLIKLMIYRAPFVPTAQEVARKMAKSARIKPGQKVYELGCGNGIILFEAEKTCPQALFYGYEVLRPVIWYARLKKYFKKSRIHFLCRDFFQVDLSGADIIFCYLFPGLMDRFYKLIYPTLKPGAKIISHGFQIKNLKPKEKLKIGKANIWIYEKT